MQTRKLFFRPGNAPRLRTAMLLGVLGVLAGSCAKEQPEPGIGGIELQVVGAALEENTEQDAQESAAGNIPQTRATETNGIFTFEDGDALSLFMRGDSYAAVDNRRVAYSKPDHAAGSWTIEGSPILLNARTAVVSLVYPYKAGATFDNIPFTTGVYSPDKDLLFKQQPVYAAVHEARVEQMQHALTRVKFNIKRDDQSVPDHFTGTGDVESVTVGSGWMDEDLLFTEGKLNLSFMAPGLPVTGTQPENIVDDTGFTLSTTGHTTDLLLVPVAEGRLQYLDLSLVIDGVRLNTSIPNGPSATEWKAGTCYTYNVTVKNTEIKIVSSTVDNWDDTGTSGSSDVDKHEPVSVGDYYYSDGTTSHDLNSTKTATGMVFWVDQTNPARYKVMALQGQESMWAKGFWEIGTSVRSFEDGRANSEAIKAYFEANKGGTVAQTEFSAAFPAAEYCYNYNTGVDAPGTWYLPALHELQYLVCAFNGSAPVTWGAGESPLPTTDNYATRDAWNARISAVAGASVLPSRLYYSSTEDGENSVWLNSFSSSNQFRACVDRKYYSSGEYARCIREVN